jgi:hypothetical protein
MSTRATIALGFVTVATAGVLNTFAAAQQTASTPPVTTPPMSTPAGAPSGNAADVSLVDQTLPIFTADARGIVNGSVFVTNLADAARTVDVTCELRSAKGDGLSTACAGSSDVPAKTPVQAVPFSVTLPRLSGDAYPIDGWVAIRAVDLADPAKTGQWGKPVAVKVRSGRTSGHDWAVFMYAAMAAALVVVLSGGTAVARSRDPRLLTHRMGTPTWTFTDSWSSTMCVAGSIVTPILTFAGLPEQGYTLSRSTYGIASLISAGLIGLAPGIYNLFRKPVPAPAGTSMTYQGFVSMFLIAAVFTVSGSLAQLGLLRLVGRDLAVAGVIAPDLADALARLWWILQAGIVIYAGVSIRQTLMTEATPVAGAPAYMMRAPAGAAQPLPAWPLL